MNDYWSIAQRHLAELRARRGTGAAAPADPLDDGQVAQVRPPDADVDRAANGIAWGGAAHTTSSAEARFRRVEISGQPLKLTLLDWSADAG